MGEGYVPQVGDRIRASNVRPMTPDLEPTAAELNQLDRDYEPDPQTEAWYPDE